MLPNLSQPLLLPASQKTSFSSDQPSLAMLVDSLIVLSQSIAIALHTKMIKQNYQIWYTEDAYDMTLLGPQGPCKWAFRKVNHPWKVHLKLGTKVEHQLLLVQFYLPYISEWPL
ncbi:hypothetical protein SLE2022_055860 [Rubroshorea leprosula]